MKTIPALICFFSFMFISPTLLADEPEQVQAGPEKEVSIRLVEKPDNFEKAYRKVQNDLKKEPPVSRLVNAALALAHAEFNRGQRWRRSSRTANILPEIKVAAGYETDWDESLDRFQDEPDRWGADTDRDFGLKITATWKFSRLLFNEDELRVQKALTEMADKREDIIQVITGHYFLRRKLMIMQYLLPLEDPTAIIEARLKIKELTAIIDALTGGALSRNLGR